MTNALDRAAREEEALQYVRRAFSPATDGASDAGLRIQYLHEISAFLAGAAHERSRTRELVIEAFNEGVEAGYVSDMEPSRVAIARKRDALTAFLREHNLETEGKDAE
jgi:hypothetical protein